MTNVSVRKSDQELRQEEKFYHYGAHMVGMDHNFDVRQNQAVLKPRPKAKKTATLRAAVRHPVQLCESDTRKLKQIGGRIRAGFRSPLTHLRHVFNTIVPRISWILLVLAWSGCVLQFVELEIAYVEAGVPLRNDYRTESIKAAVSVTTIALLITLVVYYHYLAQIDAFQLHNPGLKLRQNKRLMTRLIIELCVNALHVPPYLTVATDQFVQDKLGVFMMIRAYHVLRVLRNFTRLWRERQNVLDFANYVVNPRMLDHMEFGVVIAIKALFFARPMLFVSALCILSYLPLSYCIYVTEREQQAAFNYWPTVGYMTVVSMSQAGYGDYACKSGWGRLASCVAGVTGLLTFANFAAVIMANTKLQDEQLYATEWSQMARLRHKEQEAAAKLLQFEFRAYRDRIRGGVIKQSQVDRRHQLVRALLEVRRKVVASRCRMYPGYVTQFLALKERLDESGVSGDVMGMLGKRIQELEKTIGCTYDALSENILNDLFAAQEFALQRLIVRLSMIDQQLEERLQQADRLLELEPQLDAFILALAEPQTGDSSSIANG